MMNINYLYLPMKMFKSFNNYNNNIIYSQKINIYHLLYKKFNNKNNNSI